MYHEYFSKSPLLAYPLLSLVIFGVVFVLLVARTLYRASQSYDALAELPFRDHEETSL